ncbi:MAG: MBL fold metallo-hydrolase [Deltaproteobacteria bacterium]|nr:MBL fold metallo-hydrolase [Deltaproteobacteria bacterium]
MRRLTQHVGLATGVKIANSWLLTDKQGRRFLVDTGYFTDRPALRAHLWLAGVRGKGDLTAVLLTHRHSDHAANAAWLREKFDCPVACHAEDAPFLRLERRPKKMAVGKAPLYQDWLNLFEDAYPARTQVDETYEDGRWKWGFRVVPAPGHTEGSVMLVHEPTRTLFSGDNILAGVPPLRFIEHLSLAAPGFSQDTDLCNGHVLRFLRDLPRVDTLCSGHGPIVREKTGEKLKALLETCECRWPHLAEPAGR